MGTGMDWVFGPAGLTLPLLLHSKSCSFTLNHDIDNGSVKGGWTIFIAS